MNHSVLIVLRAVGALLGMSHLLGTVMFLSTLPVLTAGVPLGLLIVTLSKNDAIDKRPWMLVVVVALVIVSYLVTGVPFLDSGVDTVARLLHLSELIFILFFVLCNLRRLVLAMTP